MGMTYLHTMRKTTLTLCILLGLAAHAQQQPQQQPIALAGEQLIKAANNRTTAMILTGASIAFAGLASTMDQDQRTPAYFLSGACLMVGVGFNIGAIGKERKAGKHLMMR